MIYDIEVFKNLFMISFKDIYTEEEFSFIVSEKHNDLRALLLFLSDLAINKTPLIGFNNLGYDYPVMEPLLSNWRTLWNAYEKDPLGLCEFFYKRSIDIIASSGAEFYKKYYYKKEIIPQIDLMKIHHLDNKHKSSVSLKWVEFVLNHEHLQTFDYNPHEPAPIDEIDEILKYNLNDVIATYKLYKYSEKKINYRRELGKVEGINLLNLSDTSISKQLFAKYLTVSMEVPYWDLKHMRTIRSSINFKDIIFDYVEFKTPLNQALLKNMLDINYIPGETSFKKTVEQFGLHFDFGVGGLHAYPRKWVTGRGGVRLKNPESIPQVHESDDEYDIIHVDVSSYYPNIAIHNKLKPEHLGEAFTEIYNNFYEKRLKAKIEGNDLVNLAMKLSLNSVFGLSKEEHSFFYDVAFLLGITINGQLLLTMLAEEFYLNNIQMLQCNTDGIYVKIHKSQLSVLQSICDDWCNKTKLSLDFEYYNKIYQHNINNYLGLKRDGKVTKKGTFRINKLIHEDSSMKVVPMALEAYLLYGKDYREYIKELRNVTPFLMGLKMRRVDHVEERFLSKDKTKVKVNIFKKAVRYVVSKNGNPLYKQFGESGKDQKIHVGFKCLPCNDLSKVSREDIDESFYIKEVEKIASLFNLNQLKLF